MQRDMLSMHCKINLLNTIRELCSVMLRTYTSTFLALCNDNTLMQWKAFVNYSHTSVGN